MNIETYATIDQDYRTAKNNLITCYDQLIDTLNVADQRAARRWLILVDPIKVTMKSVKKFANAYRFDFVRLVELARQYETASDALTSARWALPASDRDAADTITQS